MRRTLRCNGPVLALVALEPLSANVSAHRHYRAMQARSIAEIPEPELVQVLSGHPMLRPWLFDPFLTGPSDRIFLRVPFVELAETSYRDGDVDAILLPRGEAGSAVAYQIKRVKVSDTTFQTLMPGKLGGFPKAVQQANATVGLGFSRVVLSVLIVTDGRCRREFNFAFRGPTGKIIGQVNQALDLTDLHRDIGVARIEITQPVDEDFTLAGSIGGVYLREPALRKQNPSLTSALERFPSAKAGT